ncbi:unnamed protein product, partial [Linum tenue]
GRGLDYIHHWTGLEAVLVHNHIKSSNIILAQGSGSQPFIRAMICNFGLAHASGEAADDDGHGHGCGREGEEGYHPYMSPELLREGALATQKSDVYAFGVLLLELLSIGYRAIDVCIYSYDAADNVYERRSTVETARAAIVAGDEEGVINERVRRWVDGRLCYWFPVKIAVKAMRVAVQCVDEDPSLRPDMGVRGRHYFRMHSEIQRLPRVQGKLVLFGLWD